ncbi:MAG: hypothetical protein ACRDV3_09800, partial [Acidothermaceae bacterium]
TDDGAEPARDLAAVLHHRVASWHEHATPAPGHRPTALIGGLILRAEMFDDQTPHDQRESISELEALMTARVETLTRQAISDPPRWLRQLGTPPADPRQRVIWTNAVAVIAGYRDRYTILDHGHPLGDAHISDPDRRLAHRRALTAARQARAATARTPGPASTRAGVVGRSPSL